MASVRREPELLLGDLEHPWIQLEDDLSRSGTRRLEIARDAVPATPEVEDVDRPAKSVEVRPGRSAKRCTYPNRITVGSARST